MKKAMFIITTITAMLLFFCLTIYASDEITVTVNGKAIEFTQNKPDIDERYKRTNVPLKEFANAIGVEAKYDKEKNIVTLSKKYDIGVFGGDFFGDGKEWVTLCELSCQCGKMGYWVYLETCDESGKQIGKGEWYGRMDTIPVFDIDTKTISVPVRQIAEEFGYAVTWDAETATISLENTTPIVHKLDSKQNQAFLFEVMPNIEVLSKCVEELFCADVNYSEEYAAIYESEQSYDDGDGAPALLYSKKQEAPKGDYFKDPTESSYYMVNNFKTNEEVKQYLKGYLSDKIIDRWFHNDFLEYNGNLYLQRGGRGYGALLCAMHSARFLEQKQDKYYVAVDFLLFDELDYVEILEFTKIGEKWVITDAYES